MPDRFNRQSRKIYHWKNIFANRLCVARFEQVLPHDTAVLSFIYIIVHVRNAIAPYVSAPCINHIQQQVRQCSTHTHTRSPPKRHQRSLYQSSTFGPTRYPPYCSVTDLCYFVGEFSGGWIQWNLPKKGFFPSSPRNRRHLRQKRRTALPSDPQRSPPAMAPKIRLPAAALSNRWEERALRSRPLRPWGSVMKGEREFGGQKPLGGGIDHWVTPFVTFVSELWGIC